MLDNVRQNLLANLASKLECDVTFMQHDFIRQVNLAASLALIDQLIIIIIMLELLENNNNI